MELTSLLPNIGAPVPTDILNLDKFADASPGELLHASAQLAKLAVDRLADPATYHKLPTFRSATGGDWNGYQPANKTAATATPQGTGSSEGDVDHHPAGDQTTEGPAEDAPGAVDGPVAPENYYDSLPGMGLMLGHLENLTEAANTVYAGYVCESMSEQAKYLGTPYDVSPFRDDGQYLRQTRRWSAAKTKKHLGRARLLMHTPGGDPEVLSSHPTYPTVAASYTGGRLSAEIADRIVGMHDELHNYATDSQVPPGLVDQVMAAFEWKLAEIGQTVTPEEFTQFKKDWKDQIAHELNADGPSPSQALRNPPDNAIKTKSFPDGGGRIWMDATPEVYNPFKNFVLQMLKAGGTPPAIPDDLFNLIQPNTTTGRESHEGESATPDEDPAAAHAEHGPSADTDEQQDDTSSGEPFGQPTDQGPEEQFPNLDAMPDNINDLPLHDDTDQAMAQDAQGNTYTAKDLEGLDAMSSGQKISAMLIGMFRLLLRMDPADVGIKKNHGASAQLVIVQDAQTAYRALGVPPLPPDIQRPPGPAGMTPPVIRRPNPDTPDDHACPDHDDGEPVEEGRRGFVNQSPWMPFQSQAVNVGSMHPADAEILSCDSALVAQLWDGPDSVLHQKRTKRFFTPTQRRAILARDLGCQAPGCTTPAVLSDIHHIKEWLAGGTTNVANAITLCAHHHAAIHIGKWRIRRIDGLTWFQPAPWLDPYQPLLRNLYWNS